MPGKNKGMNTAQRKTQYMNSVESDISQDQAKVNKTNQVRLMAGYGSNRIFNPPGAQEKMDYASRGVERLAGFREANVYKPAREQASKDFDASTKYDWAMNTASKPTRGSHFRSIQNSYSTTSSHERKNK
jgi:hypothetical protein